MSVKKLEITEAKIKAQRGRQRPITLRIEAPGGGAATPTKALEGRPLKDEAAG